MPRGPRPDAEGAVHHVMVRGIERRRIFADHHDYEALLSRLDRLVPEMRFVCHGWALMPNHFHLAIRTGPVPLKRLMARLGTSYARYFNDRHDRAGHLFQNRYRSRIVEDERDLAGLVLYIHRNPLRAGLVTSAAELAMFSWCGHGTLVGERPPRPFESPRDTLRLFGDTERGAREAIAARMAHEESMPEAAAFLTPSRPRSRDAEVRPEIEVLVREVCASHGIEAAQLGAGERKPRIAQARTELARRAVLELNVSPSALARALGVSTSTISRALARRDDALR